MVLSLLLPLLAALQPANAFPTLLSLFNAVAPVEDDEPGEPPGSPEFWYKLVVAIILVLAGGVFAGLTLGLMGLDELHLRVLASSSDLPVERKNAQKGLPPHTVVPMARSIEVRQSSNFLIADAIGSLSSFLAFHRQGEEPLRDDEISILNGVLELNNKKAEEIMTPLNDVVTVSADRILDHATVDFVLRSGYSRIPVHKPGHPLAFVGLLLVKQLSVYDTSTSIPVSDFPLSLLPEAPPNINCFQALDYFQTGRAHLLLLSRTPGVEGGAIGVITLEDIIEEMISEEIVDETDRYEDNVSKRRARRMKNAAVMKGIVEYRVGGRANSITDSDRTPLLSRNQSPAPPAEGERGGNTLDATTSAVQSAGGRAVNATLRPGSNLNPQYGSVIVGSPRE
ncbi:Protein MAM3 [Trametes pubescens]|uniref:Protein MAM3 n=1 Tax=Trametes pubescens TaxID=154538 RepID=A0A1M2VZ58_TRAPU|nr:Protein MAM3 [Trametes pubescens]